MAFPRNTLALPTLAFMVQTFDIFDYRQIIRTTCFALGFLTYKGSIYVMYIISNISSHKPLQKD